MENKTKSFIQQYFNIVDKKGDVVPFMLNGVQDRFVMEDMTGHDLILKARQQGFSSLILAMFAKDFLLKANSVSVVVADISENAEGLLERVKFYLESYAERKGFNTKELLQYNSMYRLKNKVNNAQYIIGTAKNTEFGRSRTITNLHLSEFAFYPNPEAILAGALQAVVPTGRFIVETTANGFNYFRELWTENQSIDAEFRTHFYPASEFYDEEFLEKRRGQLKGTRLYKQEYPETAEEAFLTSGEMYFSNEALEYYLANVKEVPQTI